MMHTAPTVNDYRQMIKALRAQREVLDKQIIALEGAVAALDGLETPQKKKRNRPKTEETKVLEEKVRNVFRQHDAQTLKLIEVIRETLEQYPEENRPNEVEMRGKFNNLRKSKFILSVTNQYGYIRLAKPLPLKKQGEGNITKADDFPF